MEEIYQTSFYGVITSLYLDENFLYCGKGNYLDIYDINKDLKISHIKIFKSNKILKIYDFEIIKDKKIIFLIGETKISYTYIINKLIQNNFFPINTFSEDYIVDCIISKNEKKEVILILGFINNYIEIYKYESNNFNFKKTLFSPKKCIVYSMSLYNSEINKILIASGTVFSEIIIWEIELSNNKKIENNNLILKGHEGVIFSVHFVNKNTLISTSDDRTSRIWEINYENKTFYSHAFFGHNSRVWDAKVNFKKNILVSISEDATARIYDIKSKKFLYECNNGHFGKNIRSLEINDYYIWTGGEDGQIIKWKLNIENYQNIEVKNINNKKLENDKQIDNKNFIKEIDEKNKDNVGNKNIKTNNNNKISNNKNNEKDLYFSFTLDDKDNQCILAKKKQKNFTPAIKYIKFLNTESIILGTNHGQIILLDIINKKMDKIFFNDKETRVINSIDIILTKFILIGLSDGNIQIIEIENFKTNSETINLFHNIRITYISHKIIKENKEFFIIFSTALGHSKIYYFQNLDIIKFEDLIKKLKPIINNFLYLNTGIRFPIGISSFELIKLENINNSYMIFLGDYGGRIYYTQIKKITNQLYNYNDIKYKQIHNDDKITNIIFSYNQNILYTFSRDGRIKKFILTNVLKFNFSLKEIDSIYKNDISSYEIVLFNKINDFENDNFFIIGHHGRNLLIYNTNSKLIIHSNDVKGVNRPLDAIYSLKNLKIYYAVSQSNKVYIYEILNKNEDKNIINKGFICNYSNFIHGRVIHNLNFFCVDKLKNIFLITSCSEDTKVNFFLIENLNLVFEKNENLIFIGQFSMHECAVRKIKIIDFIYEDENKLKIKEVFFMSIGSKCECFIYKIVLNLEKKNCQIFLLKDLTKRKNKKEKNIVNFDFENTRNLDLTSVIIWENNVKKYNIYISNSCFLTNYYLIQIEENECLIIKNEEYKNVTSNFIPLSINHVVNNSNKIFLIFGLTNGNFNILNYEKKIDLYYKLHESGINDLKIINGIKTNIFNIISSGEDCSIGISELDLNDDNLKLSLIKKIRNLHFSAIKSISLEKIDENNYFIISGSYDQLLNVCKFNRENYEFKKIKKIECVVSEINSISSSLIEYNKEIVTCIGGQGIELIKINL